MKGYLGIITPLSSSLRNRGDADLARNVFIALATHTHRGTWADKDAKDGKGHG